MWRYNSDSNNGVVSHRSRFLDCSDTLILKRGPSGSAFFVSLCYNSPDVRKGNEGSLGCLRAPRRGIYLSVAALHNESPGRALRWCHFPGPTYERSAFNRVRTGSDGISVEIAPVTQAELDDFNQVKSFVIVYGIVSYSDFLERGTGQKFAVSFQNLMPGEA